MAFDINKLNAVSNKIVNTSNFDVNKLNKINIKNISQNTSTITSPKVETPAKEEKWIDKHPVLQFAQNIPTMILRGFGGTTAQFLERTAATVGEYAGKKTPNLFKVTDTGKGLFNIKKSTQEQAKGTKKEFEKGITLPGQSTPIIESLGSYKSGKEFVGELGESILDTGLAFYGGGAIKNIGKEAIKEGVSKVAKQEIKNVLATSKKQLAKNLLRDATIGFGYGATISIQDEDSTLGSVLKAGGMGATVGAVLSPVLGKAYSIGKKGIQVANKQLSKNIERAATSLEKKTGTDIVKATRELDKWTALMNKYKNKSVIDKNVDKSIKIAQENVDKYTKLLKERVPSISEEKGFYDVEPKAKQTKKEKLSITTAKVLRTIQKIPQKMSEQLSNENRAVENLTKRIKESGLENVDEVDVADMIHTATTRGQDVAVLRVEKLADLAAKNETKNPGVWHDWKAYTRYLNDLDTLANGGKIAERSPNGKFVKNRDVFDVQKDLENFTKKMGQERMEIIKQIQKEEQIILDESLRSGIGGELSQEKYNRIKESHPNYLPNHVLDFTTEETTGKLGGKSSNTKTSIQKRKGTVRLTEDVDPSLVKTIVNRAVADENNKAMSFVVDKSAEIGEGMSLKTAEQVKARESVFSKLKDIKNKVFELLENNKELKQVSKENVSDIKQALTRKETTDIKLIRNKTKKINKEADELFEEARVMASDVEPTTKIKSILSKVETRETKVANLTTKLDKQIDEFNNRIFTDVKRKSEAIESIKNTAKLLDEEVNFKRIEQKELRDEIKGLHDIATKEIDIPDGWGKITRWKDGVKEEWLIRKDVSDALTHTGKETGEVIMNWLNNSKWGKRSTAPATAIRTLATGVNIVFGAFSNPVRDIQTILLTSKTPLRDIGESLVRTITGKRDKELLALARKHAALQGNIFKEGLTDEQIFQKMLDDKLGKKGGLLSKVSNPFEAIRNIGEKMEEMSKLAAFKGELRKGKTATEAAKIARNSTIDFSKGGSFIKIANKFIPFLNARIQGATNVLKAIDKNPSEATRILLFTAAYPTALLHAYNSKYASYENIPDYERRKYWVIMAGETNGRDLNGNTIKVPHYIKIPKGEAQQAVSNITERILRLSNQKYPESTSKFLAKLVGDFSPITESSLVPPGLQQWYELQSNYSFFRDKQIVPNYVKVGNKWFESKNVPSEYQITENTSAVAKTIGSALGWSPIKIDYVIKTGMVNDLIRLFDLPKRLEGKSSFEKTAELPLIRTIMGTSSYGEYLRKKEMEEKKEKEKNKRLIELKKKYQKK